MPLPIFEEVKASLVRVLKLRGCPKSYIINIILLSIVFSIAGRQIEQYDI